MKWSWKINVIIDITTKQCYPETARCNKKHYNKSGSKGAGMAIQILNRKKAKKVDFMQFLSGVPARDYVFQRTPYEEQVKEAVNLNVDIIMLVNMPVDVMKRAVEIINRRAVVEASGNVNLETINSIASTGVDIISSSAIVAKAPTLDLALDM